MAKGSAQPSTDLKGLRYGLLSPAGDFYACGWHEHDALAFRAGGKSSRLLMAEGWLMLTQNGNMVGGEYREEPLWYRGFAGIGRHWQPSAKQAATILEWCEANGERYPEEFME